MVSTIQKILILKDAGEKRRAVKIKYQSKSDEEEGRGAEWSDWLKLCSITDYYINSDKRGSKYYLWAVNNGESDEFIRCYRIDKIEDINVTNFLDDTLIQWIYRLFGKELYDDFYIDTERTFL